MVTLPQALLLSGLILGLASFFIRESVKASLKKEHAERVDELTRATQSLLNVQSNNLKMAELEHQVRFSGLHRKQAKVVAELYTKLVNTYWSAQEYAYETIRDRDVAHKSRGDVHDLYQFIQYNKLYFPSSVVVMLNVFVGNTRLVNSSIGAFWASAPESPIINPDMEIQRQKALDSAVDQIQKNLPALLKLLEMEFRKLLGVAESESEAETLGRITASRKGYVQ